MSAIVWGGWIVIIICSIVTIIFIVKHFYRRVEVALTYEEPFVDNFLPEFSGGYSHGWEVEARQAKNGRWVVKFMPTVMAWDRKYDMPALMKTYDFVIDANCRVTQSTGSWNKERCTVQYLRHDETGYDFLGLTNPIRNALEEESGDIKRYNNLVRMAKAGDASQAKLVEELRKGELSREEMTKVRALFDEIISVVKESKDTGDKGKTGFTGVRR